MKQIIAWALEISKGYRSVKFRFATAVEAQEFLIAWINHKSDADKWDKWDKNKDDYSIYPVFEQDENEEKEEENDA